MTGKHGYRGEHIPMREAVLSNKDIQRILRISERRVINLSEKGIVIPVVDSSGAGSRRQYSYTNLLEFALTENLLRVGLGIHLIKRIMDDLRKDGITHSWADDFEPYWSEMAAKHIAWLKKQSKHSQQIILKDGTLLDLRRLDPRDPGDLQKVKERLKPSEHAGILVYSLRDDEPNDVKVIPWDIENRLATLFLHEYAHIEKNVLMVNLGRIKAEVDRAFRE
jgi:DNA-binding transcriptional MerR regulator